MIHLHDGPLAGKSLLLRRAPVFLRVTQAGENVDGLDQLDDAPRAEESIHVYRRRGSAGVCHIHRRGGGSGFYAAGNYFHHHTQPDDATARDADAWRDWCLEQATR